MTPVPRGGPSHRGCKQGPLGQQQQRLRDRAEKQQPCAVYKKHSVSIGGQARPKETAVKMRRVSSEGRVDTGMYQCRSRTQRQRTALKATGRPTVIQAQKQRRPQVHRHLTSVRASDTGSPHQQLQRNGDPARQGQTFFLSFFFFKFLLLFNYSCLHFLPIPPPHLSQSHLPPPRFCPCVLYSSSCKPFSPLSPPHSPLAIVTLFLISMSLVIFRLLFSFVDYVPVKGEIIWHLSLTAWLISLSIGDFRSAPFISGRTSRAAPPPRSAETREPENQRQLDSLESTPPFPEP